MNIWLIWGSELQKLEIEAVSFDEAIKMARKINPNYNTGQLKQWIMRGKLKIPSPQG